MCVGPPVEKLRQLGSASQVCMQVWNVAVVLEVEWE